MSDSQLSYNIIGAAMKVHNTIGPGLREKPYENALRIELKKQGDVVEQQPRIKIYYEGHDVGDCIPDLIVNDERLGYAPVQSRSDPGVDEILSIHVPLHGESPRLRVSGVDI